MFVSLSWTTQIFSRRTKECSSIAALSIFCVGRPTAIASICWVLTGVVFGNTHDQTVQPFEVEIEFLVEKEIHHTFPQAASALPLVTAFCWIARCQQWIHPSRVLFSIDVQLSLSWVDLSWGLEEFEILWPGLLLSAWQSDLTPLAPLPMQRW